MPAILAPDLATLSASPRSKLDAMRGENILLVEYTTFEFEAIMLKTITATEANRRFSELLRLVGEGDTYIVTSHGRPRIRMERVSEDLIDRAAAHDRLLDRLRNQEGFQIVPWTRDELYDDEIECE